MLTTTVYLPLKLFQLRVARARELMAFADSAHGHVAERTSSRKARNTAQVAPAAPAAPADNAIDTPAEAAEAVGAALASVGNKLSEAAEEAKEVRRQRGGDRRRDAASRGGHGLHGVAAPVAVGGALPGPPRARSSRRERV